MFKTLFKSTVLLYVLSTTFLVAEGGVADFIMPENHPIKAKLDRLFSKTRVNFSEKSFKDAGFTGYNPRRFTRVVASKHPSFPGYYFKTYLDVQRYHHGRKEMDFWLSRCRGAELIRDIISEKGWESDFKVPVKWIYFFPKNPKAPPGFLPKRSMVVQEDMEILSDAENAEMWKSDYVTEDLLEKLHYIVKTAGLSDSTKIPNIPFAKDGRIAFIDTQAYNNKQIPWEDLTNQLNETNRKIWKKITTEKTKK